MFYVFKIVKSGLKFMGYSKTQENEKNTIYITRDDLNKISPEIITNPNAMKGV